MASLKLSGVIGLQDMTEKLIDETKKEFDPGTGLEVFSLKDVSSHCRREDGWVVLYDKVYQVKEYLDHGEHPGGEDGILRCLGHDATMVFRGVGHSKEALAMLEKYLIGILPRGERMGCYSDMLFF